VKIQKQKQIDYDGIGYGESDGWQPMYEWDKMKKIIVPGNIVVIALAAAAMSFLTRLAGSTVFVVLSALAYLLVVVPIHELLHLAALTPNVFSGKCHIFVGFSAVSAFYDGEISRGRSLLSSILPFAAITIAFGLLGLIVRDIWVYAAVVALMNAGGSWTDILMFFRTLRYIPRDAIVYGNRYRIPD